jgi:hypothetical protein
VVDLIAAGGVCGAGRAGLDGANPSNFAGLAPALGEAALRTARDLQAAVRASAAAHLSPAGQLQVATALEMTGALEARLAVLRHELLDAARHLTGAKVLAERLYGSARPPRWR